jgi:protein phosphatase
MKLHAEAANRELVTEARTRPGREGMATTYTAILLGATSVWINAGDSRLYALRGDEFGQISTDHTLREQSGDPSIPGNIITNCFGTVDGFYADAGRLDTDGVDAFLLCSDGLSDYADMSRVADVLRAVIGRHEQDRDSVPPDDAAVYLEHAASAALQLALEGGGGDNVSLLIARPVYE